VSGGCCLRALAGLACLAATGVPRLAAQAAPPAHPLAATRHAAAPATNPVPPPGEPGRIALGQTMRGELEPGDQLMADSTLADLWQFAGEAGATVTIDLRSDEFDTYLQVLDPAGKKLGEDDDSGGDLNSRLTLTLPASEVYLIVVNSAGHERRAGMYVLSIREFAAIHGDR